MALSPVEEFYGSSPIKRARRTRHEIEALQETLYALVAQERPMTVRQAFYGMVAQLLVDKTENGYRMIGRDLLDLRRSGRLPYTWIADNTRWIRRPRTYANMEEALLDTARVYRRALWNDAPVLVEVWAESDSIASALSDVTYRWDVPLMVFRGYSSEGYLYTLAEEIRYHRRPVAIYYIGDHDPSGVDIQRAALHRVREFVPTATITMERLAVTPAQIVAMGLPTKPAKTQDPRSKGFTGGTVETEAIRAPILRELVDTAIQRHINPQQLAIHQAIEASERQHLQALVAERLAQREQEAWDAAMRESPYFNPEAGMSEEDAQDEDEDEEDDEE